MLLKKHVCMPMWTPIILCTFCTFYKLINCNLWYKHRWLTIYTIIPILKHAKILELLSFTLPEKYFKQSMFRFWKITANNVCSWTNKQWTAKFISLLNSSDNVAHSLLLQIFSYLGFDHLIQKDQKENCVVVWMEYNQVLSSLPRDVP